MVANRRRREKDQATGLNFLKLHEELLSDAWQALANAQGALATVRASTQYIEEQMAEARQYFVWFQDAERTEHFDAIRGRIANALREKAITEAEFEEAWERSEAEQAAQEKLDKLMWKP